MLVNKQSNMVEALDRASGHKHSLNREACGLEQLMNGCPPIVAMTQEPDRIQWCVHGTRVRSGEVQFAPFAQHAVCLPQSPSLTLSREMLNNIEQAGGVKGFV